MTYIAKVSLNFTPYQALASTCACSACNSTIEDQLYSCSVNYNPGNTVVYTAGEFATSVKLCYKTKHVARLPTYPIRSVKPNVWQRLRNTSGLGISQLPSNPSHSCQTPSSLPNTHQSVLHSIRETRLTTSHHKTRLSKNLMQIAKLAHKTGHVVVEYCMYGGTVT